MEMTTQDARMPAGEGSSQRLEDRVYAQLLDAIRLGQYSLGERLPSENELATEFGVSRPVVRSALARLREDGLIVSRRGAGSFVSSGSATEGGGYGPLESIDDIACYFQFRKTIEAEIIARAVKRIDAEGLKALRQIVTETDRLIDNGQATIDADIRFHAKIAELSDSRFLVETLAMLRPQWRFIGKFVRSLGRTGYRNGKRDMSAEHSAILNALEAGNVAAARAAMITHIEGSERRVFKGE